jgi:hypothetical protein
MDVTTSNNSWPLDIQFLNIYIYRDWYPTYTLHVSVRYKATHVMQGLFLHYIPILIFKFYYNWINLNAPHVGQWSQLEILRGNQFNVNFKIKVNFRVRVRLGLGWVLVWVRLSLG